MIIDFHTHIWRYAEGVQPVERYGTSPEALLRDMDRAGVDKAVMVPLAYVGGAPQPLLMDNDYLVNAVRSYPDRLYGLVEVDPKQPTAAETVQHYLDEGLSGLKLMPGRHGYFMSSHNLLDPIFAICAAAKVPVFVLAPDDICSTPLQLEEMARTFPDIPAVVIGQMGRKWLLGEACMVARRTRNLYLETSDATLEVLDEAMSAGAHKMLYASHWPPDEMQMHLARHRQAIEDPEELALVLGGNAERILCVRK
jgi:predicted TIM-barrel fold metal-dependent hydrolase